MKVISQGPRRQGATLRAACAPGSSRAPGGFWPVSDNLQSISSEVSAPAGSAWCVLEGVSHMDGPVHPFTPG